MRVVHAAALTAAAMLLASITSAQGLGAAAAREREKRNATPAKPAKVYTDREVASTPTSSVPEVAPEAGAGANAEPGSADGKTAEEKSAADEKAAAAAAEAKAVAEAAWRRQLDTARKLEEVYRDSISRLEADLGNLATASFGQDRATKLNFLEENKQKLAETQANIAKLEQEGRSNGYR